jgi:hypothetical protein
VQSLKALNWMFDAATWSSSVIAKGLCFSYEYDGRKRTMIKRVPGAGETWMVYDARDRLAATTKKAGTSLEDSIAVNKYDELGPINSGNYNVNFSPVGGGTTAYTYKVNGFTLHTITGTIMNVDIISTGNQVLVTP